MAFLITLSILSAFYPQTQTVEAVTASDWKAGNIIDDIVFTDKSSMSVDQIQAFLNSKVPSCDTYGVKTSELGGGTRAQYGASNGNPIPFTCLKDYYEVPKTTPSPGMPENNYDGKPIPAGARSAAQLIWDAAQKYNISPKVLLVKLGTESAGLLSDDWPFLWQYKYVMGSHCPDSGPGGSANCDQNYAGFSIQMDSAAALLRWYLDSMTEAWWPYKKPYQNNSILWNVVERGCGSSNVFIENKATAALYTYTPYQPNAAALNNMYGTGDNCSARGNRNFWRVFNDWFGSTWRNLVMTVSGGVYAIENGTKRAFPNEIVFNSYTYNWSEVLVISEVEMSSIPNGPAMIYNIHFRNNKLISIPTGGVYLVENGTKRPFADQITFLSSYSYGSVMLLSELETQLIPNGPNMSYNVHYRDNKLISTQGGGIYLVENGKKRPFPTFQSFSNYKFDWSNFIVISIYEKDLIPDGTPMSSL